MLSIVRRFNAPLILSTLGAILIGGWPAHAQTVQCVASVAEPPTIRAEGLAELVGDVVLTCTGGVANQTRSIQVGYYPSTEVTSRFTNGTTSEALLIVDETVTPATMIQSSTALVKTVPFWNIQFVDPGPNGTRILRFTNIRVSTYGLVNPNPQAPATITALISVGSESGIVISNPVSTVAFVQPGVAIRTRNCSGTGVPDALPSGNMQYSLRFNEGSVNAMKPRVSAGQTSAPPGAVSTSESGFVRDTPLLPANVGFADTGTRFYARFHNLPAGARVFVTTEQSFGSSAGVTAALVSADTGLPVPTTTTMMCPETTQSRAAVEVPVSGNAATAVWEIFAANATAVDSVVFGFRVEVPGRTAYMPAITAGFAPFYPEAAASEMSETLPIPRFNAAALVPVVVTPQFFLQNQTTNAVSGWVMGGLNGATIQYGPIILTAAPNWKPVASGDFDRNGWADIVLQNTQTWAVSVWYMGGSQGMTVLSAPVIYSAVPGWRVVGAGDFDGNHFVDLVLQNDTSNSVSIWYLGGATGTSILWAPIIYDAVPGWKVKGAADFDSSGVPDLVLQNETTNEVSVWYLGGFRGTELLWAPIILTGAPNWKVTGASDVNVDGTPDLVLQNSVTGEVSVWYMGGDRGASLLSTPIITSAAPGWRLLATR